MLTIENKGLGLRFDLPDLRQRDVEEYFAHYRVRKAGLTDISPEDFRTELVAFIHSLHTTVRDMDPAKFASAIAEFSTGLRVRRERMEKLTGPERNGLDVRTAVECGWLDIKDVGDLSPAAVLWLASEVNDLLAKSYEIPTE